MSTTIRAFVAVRVPATPALCDVLDELGRMGRSIKPVDSDHLHVTLKFLGETDTSWIDGTREVLDAVAKASSTFDVRLHGLGAFPKPSRPSVIWTGIEPAEPMMQLAERTEQALSEFGFAPETREFRPHVTLARVKSRPPQELASLLERHATTEFAKFRVNEIVLIQSQLSPQGPKYTPLHVASLR